MKLIVNIGRPNRGLLPPLGETVGGMLSVTVGDAWWRFSFLSKETGNDHLPWKFGANSVQMSFETMKFAANIYTSLRTVVVVFQEPFLKDCVSSFAEEGSYT